MRIYFSKLCTFGMALLVFVATGLSLGLGSTASFVPSALAATKPAPKQKMIIVYGPKPRAIVRHNFVLSGRANVFEATVSYKMVSKAGRTVLQGFTNASCGTGCWGYFRKNIVVPKTVPAGYYTLYVYESSAKDGSMINIVKIWPLYMTKY